jgi:hypothetical protein
MMHIFLCIAFDLAMSISNQNLTAFFIRATSQPCRILLFDVGNKLVGSLNGLIHILD